MAKGAAGLLLCLLCHLVPLEGFRPNCTTDYATELVCLWSVGAATGCSRGVRLRYAREPSPRRDDDGPLCRIPGTDFRRTWFFMALEVNGTGAGAVARVKAEEQVKPRRLVNLTADTGRSHSVVLAWQWDAVYTQEQKEDLLLSSPTYQVAHWPAGQRDKGITHETKEQRYEIFVSRLSPGLHAASVRFRLLHFGNIWSEWSTPCKFPVGSASRPDSGDVLWMCAVVMAAILASYLCFARLKRSWWDRIPDPAKSKVTGDVMAKPQGDGSPAAAATALLSGYRDLNSLLPQPTASLSQGWEPEAGQRQASGPQGWGPAPVLPGSVPWRPSCEAAAAAPAAAALDFQPQPQGDPKAAYQNLLQKPRAAPLGSGYQSFRSALRGGLSLASPYRPFLAVLRSSLPETQRAGGGAGLDPASAMPSAGRGCLGEGRDEGRRAGGLAYP
ncbi:hypothetical protein lerEdw1_007662 [Lerista edwardsae]|nr:hypothetical protein lerEdw1_007662 [Lerista edwardsae]